MFERMSTTFFHNGLTENYYQRSHSILLDYSRVSSFVASQIPTVNCFFVALFVASITALRWTWLMPLPSALMLWERLPLACTIQQTALGLVRVDWFETRT